MSNIISVSNKPFEIELMPPSTEFEIIQNIRTILLTRLNEVPLDSEFGLDSDIVDSAINEVTAARIRANIMSALAVENRATIKTIDLNADSLTGELVITVNLVI